MVELNYHVKSFQLIVIILFYFLREMWESSSQVSYMGHQGVNFLQVFKEIEMKKER